MTAWWRRRPPAPDPGSDWDEVAARLGLTLARSTGSVTVAGVVNGVPIEATATRDANRVACTVFAASPVLLPPGFDPRRVDRDTRLAIALGQVAPLRDPELGEHFAGHWDDEAGARALLSDPAVRRRMLARPLDPSWSVQQGGVWVTVPGDQPSALEAAIGEATELATALGRAAAAPWEALAAARGLAVRCGARAVHLDGSVAGFAVELIAGPVAPRWEPGTVAQVVMPPGLPDFDVVPRDAASQRHRPLGDPILDTLVAVRWTHTDRVRDLLLGPEADAVDLRGKLLTVVGGYGRSTVSDARVRAWTDEVTPAAAERLLRDVVDLAAALARPPYVSGAELG